MNWEKRVSLSVLLVLLLFLINSCKGQSFEKGDIRILRDANRSSKIKESISSDFESMKKESVVDKNSSIEFKLIKEKEIVLAKLESQEKMAMAKLETQKSLSKEQKELALAKIQIQKDISKNDEEIALARLKNEKELADKNIAFYKMIAMMVMGVVVLALLMVYLINSRKRKNELKIHQDELRHKEYMESTRQQNEHIGKMLDVILDENADKSVKKEIVRLLKDQGKKGNLIEHKR